MAALATASPGALPSWQGRAAALSTLDACRRLRDALGRAGYGREDIAPVTNWIASARSADNMATAAHAFHGGDRFAGLVAAGCTLRFNTGTEAAEVAAIAGAATARALDEAKAKADTKNDPYVRELKRFADSLAEPAKAGGRRPAAGGEACLRAGSFLRRLVPVGRFRRGWLLRGQASSGKAKGSAA